MVGKGFVTATRVIPEWAWIARLKQCASTGELLDLTNGTRVDLAITPARWPAQHTIPAAALRAVMLDHTLRIDPRGIQIRGALFPERIDLDGVNFDYPLCLNECVLVHGLWARWAQIRGLTLCTVNVSEGIDATGLVVEGDLVLSGTLVAASTTCFDLKGARITGSLRADTSIGIDGKARRRFESRIRICADNVIVGGDINLRGAHLSHSAKDPHATADADSAFYALSLDGARITGELLAQELVVRGELHAAGTAFGGQLNLSRAKLDSPSGTALTLNHARIATNVYADENFTAVGTVRAVGATIGGNLDLSGATLKLSPSTTRMQSEIDDELAEDTEDYTLLLDDAQITGSVFACVEVGATSYRTFRAEGTVRAYGTTIGGALDLCGAQLKSTAGRGTEFGHCALILQQAKINENVLANTYKDRSGKVHTFTAIGKLSARGVQIGGMLDLSGASITNTGYCAVSLDDAHVATNLFASNGFKAKGSVSAIGGTIGGRLILSGAELSNPPSEADPDGRALILDGTKVGGSLVAGVHAEEPHRRFSATGVVLARGMTIGRDLILDGAKLTNPDSDHPDRYALDLTDSAITGDLLAGSQNGPKGKNIGTFTATGAVRARGVTVGGDVNLRGATLTNPVTDDHRDRYALDLNDSTIAGDLFAITQSESEAKGTGKFTAEGAVRARGVTVGGDVNLRDAILSNRATKDYPDRYALDMGDARITGSVIGGGDAKAKLSPCVLNGAIAAKDTTIGAELNLLGTTIDNPDGAALELESVTVSRLVLVPDACAGSVNLSRARIGDLQAGSVAGKKYLPPPAPVRAVGWKVGDLQGPMSDRWRRVHRWLDDATPGDANRSRDCACLRRRTAWLRSNKNPVSAQPWFVLADVYDRNGNPAAARKLRFAADNKITAQSPPPTRITRIIYCVVAGYGHYPLLSILSMAFLVAFSLGLVQSHRADIVPTHAAAASTAAASQQLPQPAKPSQRTTAQTPCADIKDYPCMQPLAFAINSVLPPAAGKNADWTVAPQALFLLISLTIIKLALWALAALFLAGVTGLLRKGRS